LLKVLQSSGARIDALDMENRTGLFQVEDAECAQFLIEHQCHVDSVDAGGQTPIFAAVARQHVSILRVLLEDRAQIDTTDLKGKTALHFSKDSMCCRLLLETSASPDARDFLGETPLFGASRRGHLEVVSALISGCASPDVADYNGRTALFTAAQHATLEVVRTLVNEAWADPLFQDKAKLTAAQTLMKLGAGGARQHDIVDFLMRAACESGTMVGEERRRRYCMVFDDLSDPTGMRKIPFATAEYRIALAKLGRRCPWMRVDLWPSEAHLTRGPV